MAIKVGDFVKRINMPLRLYIPMRDGYIIKWEIGEIKQVIDTTRGIIVEGNLWAANCNIELVELE